LEIHNSCVIPESYLLLPAWCPLNTQPENGSQERGVIGEEEYKREKAQLINKKFDSLDGGNPDGDWHERFKNFLTLAHQASYIAAEANFEAQRDFLRRAVSNLKLLDGNLIISYTSEFKTLAETANEDMGSLSNVMRGYLSLLTGIYYSGFVAYKKGNFVFREVIPR